MSQKYIHPAFEKIVSRKTKEAFLKQHSFAIWLTGLSGSGKTTIAVGLERALLEKGHFSVVLDGDNVRSGINNNLGFSQEDRTENIRRIAEINKLFLQSGVITINSFISPTRAMRELAKEIIGTKDFIEIFIDTPMELCEKRDVKGLYHKARQGEINNFTGIADAYEVPLHADLVIKAFNRKAEESINEVLTYINNRLPFKPA